MGNSSSRPLPLLPPQAIVSLNMLELELGLPPRSGSGSVAGTQPITGVPGVPVSSTSAQYHRHQASGNAHGSSDLPKNAKKSSSKATSRKNAIVIEQSAGRPASMNIYQVPTVFNADDQSALWDSFVLRHPTVLRADANMYGWTRVESMFVVQYLEQVIMVYGQERIKDIIRKRKDAKKVEDLDPLDPLRVFPAQEMAPQTGESQNSPQKTKVGVPPVGYTLTVPDYISDAWIPEFKDGNCLYTPSKDWPNQINGFPNIWEPIPVGTTVMDCVRRFPNHLFYTFMDVLLQNRLIPGSLWNALNNVNINVYDPISIGEAVAEGPRIATMAELFLATRQLQSLKNTSNFIIKRINARMEALMDTYPEDAVSQYLDPGHPLIRRLGLGLQRGNTKRGDVKHTLAKRAARAKAALEKELKAMSHGTSTDNTQVEASTKPTGVELSPAVDDLSDDLDEDSDGEKMETITSLEWSQYEITEIMDQASKFIEDQLYYLSLVITRDPNFKGVSRHDSRRIAETNLATIMNTEYDSNLPEFPKIDIDLDAAKDLANTVRAQLEAESQRVLSSLDYTRLDEVSMVEMVDDAKMLIRDRMSVLYLAISLFVSEGIANVIRGDKTAVEPLKPSLRHYHKSYAVKTLKVLKALDRGSSDPRHAICFGGDIATLLGLKAIATLGERGERRLKRMDSIGELLEILVDQRGTAHESLQHDPELQSLSDGSYDKLIKAMQKQAQTLKPPKEWKAGARVMYLRDIPPKAVAQVDEHGSSDEAVGPPKKKAKSMR